ncbi:MAG: hypothetical protein CBB70_16100 [Planctomycetaceae bacterium TMED10]|nr:MAG: hypothetical protein CBB70_16100 [Planctomycetaceae bacterium TMED10]
MAENSYVPPVVTNSLPEDDSVQEAEYFAELQCHVNSLLIRGIVFSVIWILGFGSAYSVFLAFQAWRIIRRSKGAVRGMGRVWWCFIVGGIGTGMLALGLIIMFINSR